MCDYVDTWDVLNKRSRKYSVTKEDTSLIRFSTGGMIIFHPDLLLFNQTENMFGFFQQQNTHLLSRFSFKPKPDFLTICGKFHTRIGQKNIQIFFPQFHGFIIFHYQQFICQGRQSILGQFCWKRCKAIFWERNFMALKLSGQASLLFHMRIIMNVDTAFI